MLEVILATLVQGYRQAERHSTLTAALVGSNPTSPAVLTKVIFFIILASFLMGAVQV